MIKVSVPFHPPNTAKEDDGTRTLLTTETPSTWPGQAPRLARPVCHPRLRRRHWTQKVPSVSAREHIFIAAGE
jgi:hypothetical protein